MSRVAGLKGVCESLLSELNKRFAFIMDENSSDFDCTYMIATLLDPQLRLLIPEDMLQVVNRNLFKFSYWILKVCKLSNYLYYYFRKFYSPIF
jgi:hypothetical protein